MNFKVIALAALFTSASLAEIENFNMAVDGNFITDFCTINTPATSFNFGTIDAAEVTSLTRSMAAQDATGKPAFITPTVQTMSITCAYGTLYDIYPDIPSMGHLVGASTAIGFNIREQLVPPNYVQVASNSNPIQLFGSGEEQLIDIEMWFSSLGTISDLENSVSTVVPWILQTN
tara:strand:+ start:12167 stop:12691 length:525 start_codon:yes stop_codon:yes gene_type:complete